MTPVTTRIENWSYATTSAYIAPENSDIAIYGECHDHPSLPDGSKVQTGVSYASLKRFVSRSGRHWELGTPGSFHDQNPLAGKLVTPEGFLAAFGEVSVGRAIGGCPLLVEQGEVMA